MRWPAHTLQDRIAHCPCKRTPRNYPVPVVWSCQSIRWPSAVHLRRITTWPSDCMIRHSLDSVVWTCRTIQWPVCVGRDCTVLSPYSGADSRSWGVLVWHVDSIQSPLGNLCSVSMHISTHDVRKVGSGLCLRPVSVTQQLAHIRPVQSGPALVCSVA